MPRLPAKQREAEKISTPLPGGGYAASANDVPSRKTWDSHATSLLTNLDGDRKTRKRALEDFIEVLKGRREEFRREKKTGAGVTSEAIDFYQFVLKLNLSWKAKSGRKRLSSSPKQAEIDSGDEKHQEDDNSSVSSTPEEDEDDEFLNQHNDFCQVCLTGGELICCSTCSLVFHLSCVQPRLKSMPPDSWSCAHCDASGVTGLKKDSKQRKRAMQAVRDMERITKAKLQESNNQKQRGINESDTPSRGGRRRGKNSVSKTLAKKGEGSCNICGVNGDDVFPCSTCENTFHVHCVKPPRKEEPKLNEKWSCAYCEMRGVTGLKKKSPKRLAAAAAVKEINKTMAAYLDDNIEDGDSLVEKRKESSSSNYDPPTRQRRQPTLFNPSKDGLQIKIKMGEGKDDSLNVDDDDDENSETQSSDQIKICKDEIPSHIIKKLSSKLHGSAKHGFHCKFCMDDETSQTCCFCACRICFSKHDKQNTILCDMCDAEYHTFCLSPPLKRIPTHDWFCPTCRVLILKAQKGNRSNEKNNKPSPTSKRTPSKAVANTSSPRKKAENSKNQRFANSVVQPRTENGRFAAKARTNDDDIVVKDPPAPAVMEEVEKPKKRGPGRPPKNRSKIAKTGQPTRGRGRPPNPKPAQTARTRSNLKTKKGVAQNVTTIDIAQDNVKHVDKNQEVGGDPDLLDPDATKGQRSRSGRVVKRTKPYDEMIGTERKKPSVGSPGKVRKSLPTSNEVTPPNKKTKLDKSIDQKSQGEEAGLQVFGKDNTPAIPTKDVERAKMLVKDLVSSKFHDEASKPSGETMIIRKDDSSTTSKVQKEKVGSPNPQHLVSIIPSAKTPVPETKLSKPLSHKKLSSPSTPVLPASYSEQLEASRALVQETLPDKPASSTPSGQSTTAAPSKTPRRKPGARECMQISRRFAANIIPQHYVETLLDYCTRGKVEHLIRMRERLDEHSTFLESQLAGLEMVAQEHGEEDATQNVTTDKVPTESAKTAQVSPQK